MRSTSRRRGRRRVPSGGCARRWRSARSSDTGSSCWSRASSLRSRATRSASSSRIAQVPVDAAVARSRNGLFVSLFFLLKFRETRAEAALHRTEAERHRLAKLALESELKLMQAQVEPHFLFNTLASVQYLTETDPPQASALLGHLLAYLRAALPQLRSSSTTLGPGNGACRGLSADPQDADGLSPRIHDRCPQRVARAAVSPGPPDLVVENAVTHGLEPRPRAAACASRRGARAIGSWWRSPIRAWVSGHAGSRPVKGVGPRQRARADCRAVRLEGPLLAGRTHRHTAPAPRSKIPLAGD